MSEAGAGRDGRLSSLGSWGIIISGHQQESLVEGIWCKSGPQESVWMQGLPHGRLESFNT